MKKIFKCKNLFLVTFLAIAGFFSAGAFVVNKEAEKTSIVERAEAGSETKTRILLEIQDEFLITQNSPHGGGNPVLHIWDIVVDPSMGFDSTSQATLFNDLDAAGVINDFELGSSDYRSLNKSSKWIETSFTWSHWGDNGYRYWNIRLPWYITSCSIQAKCGDKWSVMSSKISVSGHGRYMYYFFKATGAGNDDFSESLGGSSSSSLSNSYSVTNYTITAAKSGGGSSTAQVKGNGGSYVASGNYFPRQKISLKATPATGFTFSSWNAGKSTSSADNYDYVGTAAKTYTATFAYAAGRYIVGTFPPDAGDDWSVTGGIFMTSTATAGEYSGTVTLAFGDMVKIPYWNGSSLEYNLAYDSYDALLPTAAANYCFGSNGGSNHEIKCYAAGSYTFYFKDSAYDGQHKISVAYNGSLTAQHLAAKLMNFTENVDHCGDEDRFPAMRTIYLGLSSSEQSIFKGYNTSGTTQFLNAYNRYTAWARALGEDPWSSGKAKSAISTISPFSITGEQEDSVPVVLIIIASSISILSITALSVLMVKKRKSKQQ